MSITNITYAGHALLTAPKIDTDLLWGLTAIFIGLALVYFFSVFFFRNKISSRSATSKQRKKELSPMISEFLFYDDDVDKAEKSKYIDLKIQIRELLKNDFNRKVLTEILLHLRKDVSGDTKARLFKLYQDLGLEKDAFEKLRSWRWEVVSKGISQLTQMHVSSAYCLITKFINHKRATIRKQAEIAIVTLEPEGINYFLDTTRYKISEWQQVKLLEVVRNQKDFDPPRFKMWLTSTNKHVVLFALRLIKYYNQNDANTSLIELVKHKNNRIKAEALSCINEFNVVEALPTLKQVFSKCNTDIKIAILGAVGNLGGTDDIYFLQDMAQRERNFSVKSKALAAINMILPDTILPTKGIENIGVYQEPDIEIENHKGAISPDAQEVLGEETRLASQDTKCDAPEEDLVGDETHNQEEVLLEKDEELSSERLKIENDVLGDLKVIHEKVFEPETNSNPSETKNRKQLKVDIEEIVNNSDIPEKKLTVQVDKAFDENPEAASSDSGSTAEETTSKPNEPISKSVEKPPNTNAKKPSNDSQDRNFFDFDFIPIVATNKSNPDKPLEKHRLMSNTENQVPELNKIEVDFEEIIVYEAKLDKDSETSSFDVSEINFLPMVIDTDNLDQKDGSFMDEGNTKVSLLETEVFYEEVNGLPMDDELHNLITEINELNFLPIVINEEVAIENGPEEDKPEVTQAVNDIDGHRLSDIEVNFEETPTQTEEETFFELADSPIIDIQGLDIEDVMSWFMVHNELRESEVHYEIVSADTEEDRIAKLLPEPIYYDEHEAYMMGLLDDLEVLGDSREIPFLEELLAVEKKGFIKDRISNLIDRFAIQTDGQTTEKNNMEDRPELPRFSVFADLFKSIDTECKLILLDEIFAVGDEKEIPFLDGLLEDPHPDIRKKAQESLKLLIAKISGTDSADEHIKKQEVEELPTRLFDVHTSKAKSKNEEKAVNIDSLLDAKATEAHTDHEIFDIDFELAEILDKEHSKSILELPVIATEISPNGASFFFSTL